VCVAVQRISKREIRIFETKKTVGADSMQTVAIKKVQKQQFINLAH
jgi:hypothetical protein